MMEYLQYAYDVVRFVARHTIRFIVFCWTHTPQCIVKVAKWIYYVVCYVGGCFLVYVFGWNQTELFIIKRCEQGTTRDVENIIIRRSKLKEEQWSPEIDSGQKPVLVFCVISSRIGTDIDSAMKGVHVSSNVILVLLHFMHKSLLTGDLSDNEFLLDQETKKRFAGIAHFAFSEQESLYNCRQNQEGFTKINQLVSEVSDPKLP